MQVNKGIREQFLSLLDIVSLLTQLQYLVSGCAKIKYYFLTHWIMFFYYKGIKPVSIVSYNHLGNNDGKNLSAPEQFRSKEISKSNVVDDMVESNSILYEKNEKPDHCVSEKNRTILKINNMRK